MHVLQTSSEKVELCSNESFCTITYTLTFEGKRRTPCALIINEESITADFGPLGTIEDRLLSRGNLLVLTRNWNLRQQGSYRLQAAFSYDDQELENKLFIPALWYQDNNKGKGCFPSRERSANWSFLETRMSIPCCAQLSNGKRLFTCASKPATDKMFVASVAPDRHGLIISIPGSEWPYSYQGKQSLVDTSSLALPCLEVSSQGLAYTRTFYLSNQKAGSSLEGYCQFVQGLNALSPEDKVEGIGWDHWF